MTAEKQKWRWKLFGCSLFSPRGLLIRALIISIVFAALHLSGIREYTSILCGTYPTGDKTALSPAFWGLVYVIVYFSFVIIAPILVIAAGLMAVFLRKSGRRTEGNNSG